MTAPENQRRRATDQLANEREDLAKEHQAALVRECLDRWALWDGIKVVVPPCK
jgi:hypothetical protein